MELRVSAQDKEISDDDDDRNHKHRRRDDDTQLQLLEDDAVYTKPYRKGGSKRGSQSNETWKKYSFTPAFTHFSRGPSEKSRVNQQFSVDPGVWSQPFFAGRGSNSRGPSWGPFGIPNGGMDMNMIHPLGLQGTFRPPMNPSLNMGFGRQQCRDFEEQGFCLRGDMCPMEHGVNRIVVEDVQSLSQFNLPVSLATTNLSIPPAGTGPSPATITTTNMLSNNSKNSHDKNIKHVDFYDPDQPLWGNNPPAGPQSDDSDHELVVSTSVGTTTTPSPSTSFYAHGTIKKRTEINVVRKPSQKAERTLFVNGIPEKSNKKETLISHFKRFGEVVDIYIPLNTQRAFVQFSKREEAEAALMAPDAVMGNRFIKMWWANRDNIKRKDDSLLTLQNDVTTPVVSNDAKVAPPLQKKLENLEVLKEELRKKQEMLDRKRVDFRRKLDKLAKQATVLKGERLPEQVTKKQKLGDLSDFKKVAGPGSSDGDTDIPSLTDDVAENRKQNSKTTLALKSAVATNRFKLDNRPTAFKIVPPLPDGLADVAVIKEHFSPYGEISKVELDDNSDHQKPEPSAQIYFTTRHAAEKAFLNGKKWKGHNLQLTWLNSSTTSKHNEIPKTDSLKAGDVELEKSESNKSDLSSKC